VQDGDETIHLGAQAFVGCQFLAQGAGCRFKQQFVSLLFTWTHETTAQLRGQREGYQEVGRMD